MLACFVMARGADVELLYPPTSEQQMAELIRAGYRPAGGLLINAAGQLAVVDAVEGAETALAKAKVEFMAALALRAAPSYQA